MTNIKAPALGYSLACIDAESVYIDWSSMSEGEDYELILPDPTYGDWQDHSSNPPSAVAKAGKRKCAEPLPDELADEWRDDQPDSYYEWRDGFAPMMNYAWPVSTAYGAPDLATIVALISEHGAACTLIEPRENMRDRHGWEGSDAPEYLIALSGGGMNLSDHIAAAYLACGCVPPQAILSGLSGVISQDKARRIGLRAAYRTAADAYRSRAKRLASEAARVFKPA